MSEPKIWTEFEDWGELYRKNMFYQMNDGSHTLLINFGGPGAAIDYHMYVRVNKGFDHCFYDIRIDGAEFVSKVYELDIPRVESGYTWIHIGHVNSCRDYRSMRFSFREKASEFDCLCVLQNTHWMEEGEIERRVQRRKISPEPLSGVPLGGAGAGKIEYCADGVFRNITINGNIDTPIRRSESSFYALHATCSRGSQTRIIAEEPLYGLESFKDLSYKGVYPFSDLSGSDDFFPLNITITSFCSVIPRNIKDSSLPVAFFKVRLSSKESSTVSASLLFSLENFLGTGGGPASRSTGAKRFDEGFYELFEEKKGNMEEEWHSERYHGLRYTSGPKNDPRGQGEYILATESDIASYYVSWDFHHNTQPVRVFAETGTLPQNSSKASQGEKTAGVLCVKKELKPRESVEIRFVFSWYVPEFHQVSNTNYGHYYCNHFNSAPEVACYALDHFAELEGQSREVPTLLRASTLPSWFAEMLCNDAYVFSTNTWHTLDGRFSINEGPTHMFGCMGTLDQKLYGSHYYSLFFPKLDVSELTMFIESQSEDGGVQHDLGFGHIDQKGRSHAWPDLSSALVILSLKHFQMTNDTEFINKAYKNLRKALLEYQIGMDSDGDYIANISGVGNTFDSEKFEGTSSYIASVWLAALLALEKIALTLSDNKTAKTCRDFYEKARSHAIEELWNGSFFVNYYDSSRNERCETSHISQVAGEHFTHLCGLESTYGEHYVRQAIDAIFTLNYPAHYVFPTNEATPDGYMPRRSIWGWLPHSKVYLAALPMYYSMTDRALNALKRLYDVVKDKNNNNWWDQRIFYEPDTGKQHWGRFYMSSPASWYAYQALLGYMVDLPSQKFKVRPHIPDSLLPFEGPLFLPDWWAWIRIDKNKREIHLRTIKSFVDTLLIKRLELPDWHGQIIVRTEKALSYTVPRQGSITFDEELNLAELVDLSIHWI